MVLNRRRTMVVSHRHTMVVSRRRTVVLIRRRVFVAAIAVALLVGVAPGAASADSARQRRDTTHHRRQVVQIQLNLAVASDSAVEAEVGRLNRAVTQQEARLAAARQAEQAAQMQVDAASQHLADIEARASVARGALAGRAVDAYMAGGGAAGLAILTQAHNLEEASRRQTYLDVVQANTTQLIDELRADREDAVAARRDLEKARGLAVQRADTAAQEALTLLDARHAEQTVHDELQRRINGLQEESRQLAAQEGQLEALIRAQEAADSGFFTGPVSNVGLIWPLHGPVTSEFGPRYGGFHPGIDIAAAYGTPIHAAKAGVVIFAGWYGGYGNFVIIDHGGGLATAYGHQSRIAVSQGQHVSQGDVVGFEGSTGYSTGPHLHFEVRINGNPQNPRGYESGSP